MRKITKKDLLLDVLLACVVIFAVASMLRHNRRTEERDENDAQPIQALESVESTNDSSDEAQDVKPKVDPKPEPTMDGPMTPMPSPSGDTKQPLLGTTPSPTPPEDSRKSDIPTPSPYTGPSDQEIIERFEKEYTMIPGPSTNSPVILVFTENGITTIMVENKAIGEIDPELIELLRRYGNLMIKNQRDNL